MTERQHWAAEPTSYRMERKHKPVALVYDPTPGGRKNADGTTSQALRFPALLLTEYVSDQDAIAEKLAVELNSFDDMLAALQAVNKLISEAALAGFNCHDGDWAERLFHSQQATSKAIKKATALSRAQEKTP